MLSFLRRRPNPNRLRQQFLERFTGRTLIVHEGFPPEWLEELLKQPGGGGHFRLDVRQINVRKPSPIEWFVREHVLPLGLPLPLLVRVSPPELRVRHLRRGNHAVHPSEIQWFLEELDTRAHATLRVTDTGFTAEPGIPVSDNEAKSMLDHLGL
ncbi:hypothetical protein Tgr7_3241 [Thioalkalivibrio sulfidiphilus HL-EbGr7]|uniref:Uncharacterized protein n=1 Tax=Thioalkalivibrio sulfidiphilus (strain HL-EbGR7) TaxID=396588 RepID=B8GQT5_THISH|nr:hypothetical protein [Thioalkalivibrio sulfidiphilus]ACL74309.1 hypothetical protein Tgr7_3241 [Thioalkalivibrio sulfidiphilus HL-EbGr7]